ncbi:hypothetical protein J0A67_12060 [Algoriphagus aestuariicola]|jgi:hypothetical protein|uniref:Uncharacterized protein n=1 Tax=Algoriphagus aestuariicola TaxID=1852016 RepID=A0ABS3BTC9_9BACT|nr:hypothetical protein [Algoriphagus aestuariicola]MBN7801600.1 hypothetical protein [Algoriphagus aestuariicola]
MFDLFWSFFNVAFLVAFVYFLFKLVRRAILQLPDRQSLLATPVLTIGLIAFLAGLGESAPEKGKTIGREFTAEHQTVKLTLANRLHVTLVKNNSDGRVDPGLSYSIVSGFVLGRKWNHLGIKEKNGQIAILGHMKYNLLGWEIMGFSREIPL